MTTPPARSPSSRLDAIAWDGERLTLLDQRRLPEHTEHVVIDDVAGVHDAIRQMVVRGAPAIGIVAAYGVVLSARARGAGVRPGWRRGVDEDIARLAGARPTAINLAWALARMGRVAARSDAGLGPDPAAVLDGEARRIHDEDVAANRRMGELGAALIGSPGGAPAGILTHCNAGALATGGYGTALGVVRSAHAAGKVARVFADETRPWLQGARLTAWELERDGIPVDVITDAAASYAMRQGKVDWVVVGADRIAANGDVANKIGTYALAVSAHHHGIGFMVVAPTSTVDLTIASGEEIPIEIRDAQEVLSIAGRRVAPVGAGAWNPVFDVTPAALVGVIVTERGVVHRPDTAKLAALMAGA